MREWILTSSLLILAVLLIRALGRDRLSARVRYALWALVLLRLLVPFSIGESALSVQNWLPEEQAAELTDEQLRQYASSHIDVEIIENEPQFVPQAEASAERWDAEQILRMVYGVGCILVGGVFLVSNVRFALGLHRSRRFIIRQTLPVYETAAVDTPCLFGAFPKIYVTPSVREDENALRHVLAHELTHYRHGDHIWSLLRCVCVTIHWYNPLVWAAAFISQKDAEMACDEGALLRLGEQERTGYAKTLLELTCVGYKGMLTAATSMTGSDSDLKQRVLRIAKNPKMSVIAVVMVLVVAILVTLTVFTAAKAPAIEGVWRMELSHLGVGVNEPASAYMEYEFYDGLGRRIDYVGGEIRSAESFGYRLDGDELEITFGDDPRTEQYSWSVEKDTLTLRKAEREMVLTSIEQSSVPYLPNGFVSFHYLFSTNNQAGLHYVPDETTQAKLLALLRSGEMKTVGAYGKNGVPCEEYLYILHHDGGEIIIADDMVVAGNSLFEDGYALSNIAEIKALLDGLDWRLSGDDLGDTTAAQLAPNLETTGFVPEDMTDVVEARMIVYGNAYPADPAQLAFLEELLTTAEDIGYPTKCPFEGILEVTLSDGRVLGVAPAMDSCSTFMIGDTCYEYGNQFATDDEGSYDNSALLAVFGLTPELLEEIIISNLQPTEGEVLGTNADIGDVVREQNDVMEPTYLSDEAREAMIALLAQGIGEAIEGEFVYDTTYYTIFSSGQDTEDGFVLLSDNGSLSMDGVVYELRTGQELLRLLDTFYNQIRITVGGYPVTDLTGVTGEFLYPELGGVPEGAEVVWKSEDEAVCTVTGDAYGAEIYITGVGEATVIAEYTENGQRYGYSVRVCGTEP